MKAAMKVTIAFAPLLAVTMCASPTDVCDTGVMQLDVLTANAASSNDSAPASGAAGADSTCTGWIQGDGYGGSETRLGVTNTCQECIALVLSRYPNAAAATFRDPSYPGSHRKGQCYAEHGYTHASGSSFWITVPLPLVTASPTPAPPTPAPPTPAPPTPAPTVGAKGDPHMTNILGQRFDLAQPGEHTLVRLPKDVQDKALLQIKCEVKRMSASCADSYIQRVNVTGAWVKEEMGEGMMMFQAQEGDIPKGWITMKKIQLKVVRGTTKSGILYLNIFTKNLGATGMRVGGLLGEDEHTSAATPPSDCVKLMSLMAE